jgi:GT2 family glycosyltransferase
MSSARRSGRLSVKPPRRAADYAGVIRLVAFSKDRPAQLDLLLRSIERFVPSGAQTAVVYTASEELHDRGYAVVRDAHPWAQWVDEREAGGFRAATLGLVAEAGERIGFLVDDIVFTHPLDVDAAPLAALDADPEVLCCSLRLDPGKTYCYALDRPMTPPPATTWHWMGMEGDWGYPMSLDGHIFRTAQIAPLLERLTYRNPNELEAALAEAPLALPKVTCFGVARIVNVPDNRVQDTAPNRHGGGSAARFTPALLAGCRLDLEPFAGLAVPSVHHEMPLRFAADGPAPRVSVVVPCHDMATTLAETLQSVAAQELDGEVEVIVVDDGSTDGSGELAASLGATVLRQPPSGHPAHARNTGFAAAAAPYVLPLDADDLLEPGFLATAVAALDADPAAGFAYGDVREFGAGQADELHVTGEYDFVELTHRNRHGSASLVRHEAWQAVGGYDAGVGYEDWDLWLGLGLAGWHGVKAPGAIFAHRRSDAGRWALDKGRDREIKARFVLKRPGLYDVSQQRWAEAVLAGDPMMASLGNEEGVIPSFVAPAAIDSRRFAVAALAEEILSDPELLRAYGGVFGADDDVSLVIYGQSHLVASLGPVVAAAGVDGPGSPDLLAVEGGIFQAAAVAASSGALLTRRAPSEPFAALPRFDVATLSELRGLAIPEPVSVSAPVPVPAPAALAGYPAEAPDAPAKREHLLSLFRARGHRTLLESGTFMGDTVEYFMPHAARIISVEVEPKLFADAQRKFEGVANVELVFGDALHVIPDIVARLEDPPLIWLDGHFSEGVTGSGDEIEPAASILARLGAVGAPAGTTLVVDDLRLFGLHPDFPGLDELVQRARQGFPEAQIRVGLDSLVIES